MPISARHTPAYRVAALAHELWRESLAAHGWKRARAYDESLKRHDALVPFADVPPHDRRRIIARIEASDLVSMLVEHVEHPRGDDRELSLADMHVGRAVGLRRGDPDEAGRIESWTTEPNAWGGRGRRVLADVRVRWPDGEITEHAACERELRLLD